MIMRTKKRLLARPFNMRGREAAACCCGQLNSVALTQFAGLVASSSRHSSEHPLRTAISFTSREPWKGRLPDEPWWDPCMDDVLERLIRERALAIWERDGRSGCATEHWLMAEREIKAGLADPARRMLSRFAADRRRRRPKLNE